MNFLFYGPTGSSATKNIEQAICAQIPGIKIDSYQDLESFSLRLRRFLKKPTTAIIVTPNQHELSGILAIRNLLSSVRIILFLPDREKETIAKGHKLLPRFLSSIDDDFRVVAAVLAKMTGLNADSNLLGSCSTTSSSCKQSHN